MIAVKPGTPAWEVLALVVANPGDLDAESIGARLFLPKRFGIPEGRTVTMNEYLAWRAQNTVINQHGKVTLSPESAARASRLLGRLTEAGMVVGMRGPELGPGIVPQGDLERWAETLVHGYVPDIDADTDDNDEPLDPPDNAAMVALLRRLVESRPPTVDQWIGPRAPGNVKRAAAELYKAGIVISPSLRWPTAKGTAHIQQSSHSKETP